MRHLAALPAPRAVTDPILPAIARILHQTGDDSTAFVAHLLALDQVFPTQITRLPGLAPRLAALVEAIRRFGPRAVTADHLSEGN